MLFIYKLYLKKQVTISNVKLAIMRGNLEMRIFFIVSTSPLHKKTFYYSNLIITFMEATMKKSLSAIVVILLTVFGFKSEASILDQNVKRTVKETSDSTGNQNEGSRTCSTKPTK